MIPSVRLRRSIIFAALTLLVCPSFGSEADLYTDNICGPVILSLISGRHGVDCTVQSAIKAVEMRDDGTSMMQMLLGARKLGIKAEVFELTDIAQLQRLGEEYSAVVQIDGDHFAGIWWKGKDLKIYSYPNSPVSFAEGSERISSKKVLVLGSQAPRNPFQQWEWRILGISISCGGFALLGYFFLRSFWPKTRRSETLRR